jgi:uncharacterized protein (DUF362 family)
MADYVAVMRGKAKEATLRALKQLDPKVVGSKILVKPNLASRVKDNGENTDVRVVEGIVEFLQGRGEITIAEGCCGGTNLKPDSTYDLFDFADYSKLEGRYGVKLFDLNTDEFQKIKLFDKELGIAKKVLDTDYLVSVPVLKTHVYTMISACVKNLMGCLEPRPERSHETATKWEIHAELTRDSGKRHEALKRFEGRLIELYRKLSPKLGVIDAITASEGDSPVHGTPVHMGLIIASENSISCDAVAAYLMGIEPTRVGFLQLARNMGLGETSINDIETNSNLEQHRRTLKLPSTVNRLLKDMN